MTHGNSGDWSPKRDRGAPEPKAWVKRLVEAQSVELTEKQLGWWSFHLESLLRYCRQRGEQVDVRILACGSFDRLPVETRSGSMHMRPTATDRGLGGIVTLSTFGEM